MKDLSPEFLLEKIHSCKIKMEEESIMGVQVGANGCFVLKRLFAEEARAVESTIEKKIGCNGVR